MAHDNQQLQEIVLQIMGEAEKGKFEIEVEGLTEKGSGYLADLTFFKVTDGNESQYNLVLKSGKMSEELRSTTPAEKSYKREVYMYTKVFPTLKKFLREKNCDLEIDYVPKIYWHSEESVVLENLKSSGYVIWNTLLPIDLENAISVMKLLGKHHGICLAFADQRNDEFEEMVPNLTNIWTDFSSAMDADSYFGTLMKNVLTQLEKNGKHHLVKKFQELAKNMKELVYGVCPQKDRLVIAHADCWLRNMMIKYQGSDSTKPEDICLIDFQLCCLDTPVNDLSLFIYSACDQTLLDKLPVLLKEYYNELSKTMTSLGSNPDLMFSYQQLLDHWAKYSTFGLAVSPFVVKLQMLDKDEAQDDITQVIDEQDTVQEEQEIKHIDLYNQRMIEVFTHYGEMYL